MEKQNIKHKIKLTLVILTILITASCGSVHYNNIQVQENGFISHSDPELDVKINNLKAALISLAPDVNHEEAKQVAETAILYPLLLANKYELEKPPVYQNYLINSGSKKRGLCIHWAEDILIKLSELDLKSFNIYWAIANRNKPFVLEHSSPVIAPLTHKMNEGIVLDGWRNSGELFWAKVTDDKYEWENRYSDPTRTWKKKR